MANLSEIAQRLSSGTFEWVDNFNGNQVEIRVMRGAIANWHIHKDTDEMFVVLSGSVSIDTENGSFDLSQHDCLATVYT